MRLLLAAMGDNIKARGRDRWVARCPVHNDKDFAMGIKQLPDGSVIANCLACGANGLDLYRNLHLDLDELFGGKKNGSIPMRVLDQLDEDRFFIAIYDSDIKKGIRPKLKEKRRYQIAKARSKGIREKWCIE